MLKTRVCLTVLAAVLLAPAIPADEGMWLFTKPPKNTLKEKYSFDKDEKWYDHVQKSSVRFPGGSGSFVSADGLVMTNHHVALRSIQRLSGKGKDYVKDGFHARSREDEQKCEGLELYNLQRIEDVTEQVNAAVKPDMKPEAAAAARRGAQARLEKESKEKSGLQTEVVTLYQGGQYHLYYYKKYTDIRLVFAPEKQIAFFGGDPDNFEYPRFDLDVTFFRAYVKDKPAQVEHFFKWSPSGAKENDLVFVSGHPGSTKRLNTLADLGYWRDTGLPFRLQTLNRLEVLLSVYSDRNAENRRQAQDMLFGIANSRKALNGEVAGLLDPELMKAKRLSEEKVLAAVKDDEKLKDAADAWNKIESVQKIRVSLVRPYTALETSAGFSSDLFSFARTLVRAGDEREKKNEERLPEYRDTNLESVKRQLLTKDEKQVYPELEISKIADWLTFLAQMHGYNTPVVQKALGGKSPRVRAAEVVSESKLKDVAVRKKLYEGGKTAVDDSSEPLIELVKIIDPEARRLRKRLEVEVGESSTQAYAKIARARYAVEGDSVYPDATFTLRLAFGTVKGYEEDGKKVPFETTFKGLYERSAEHNNKAPFDLPPRWLARKDKLDLSVPFNFVCTTDIIGGNSGSPVVNRDAEVVGIIFDGNIQSLVADFAYTDTQGRAVAVHSRGILEALTKVYDASELVEEITGKKQ